MTCEHCIFKGKHFGIIPKCNLCECVISIKTACLECECPVEYWKDFDEKDWDIYQQRNQS